MFFICFLKVNLLSISMPRSFITSTCCNSWSRILYGIFGFLLPRLNIKDLLSDIFRPESIAHE
ncbi:unnamed protein product [Meloidogyne enterolobii]|uniref:Uncharacterized protein n=1 Tax=Meloidogyne enterolobii TaxID=390850 RepID=A0ACB0ZM63_MELEN